MSTEWKQIPNYSNYYINNLGHIKRTFKNGKVRFYKSKNGLLGLCRDGYGKTVVSVSKVVASLFGNLRPSQTVMICDGDIDNTHIENIKVTTDSTNFNRYCGVLSRAKRKDKQKVYQYDNNRNLIKVHDNIRLASKTTGAAIESISRCANYRRKTAGGYVWRY